MNWKDNEREGMDLKNGTKIRFIVIFYAFVFLKCLLCTPIIMRPTGPDSLALRTKS